MSKKLTDARVKFLCKLAKWYRAFDDDVLAEHAAIELYEDHILELGRDFGIPINKVKLSRKPFNLFHEEGLHKAINNITQTLGISKKLATEIVQMLNNIVVGPIGEGSKDQSIRHVIAEENEHKKEFRTMQKTLRKIREKLEL